MRTKCYTRKVMMFYSDLNIVHYIGTPRTPGPRQTLKPCEFPDAAPAVGVRSSRENSALRLHFDICPDA